MAAVNFLMFALAGLLLVGAINKTASAVRLLEEARKLNVRARLRGK